ncbi:Glutaminyl-peptide cyclotransferase [Eumeta japonica]|uniref:glutaminyl-peptide cyclotransferase n=1 Tax=Eumeta variegata TaxID=151549 RepID=A0A4C1VLI8_EUMVA|nr:Glutaminyl-peptide cyclotransferase [Eumeta japonica]
MCSFIIILLVTTFGLSLVSDQALKFYEEKSSHEAKDLSSDEIKELAALGDMDHFKTVLNEILIPRIVGTPNHEKVGNYIIKQMRDLGWTVEENAFVDNTPVFGPLTFKNIIAKLNPDAERYLVLACHYDSKYTREHVFVVDDNMCFKGATDSAVPCAMMINLAKVLSAKLESHKTSNLSLMLIFFDGEEAFRHWGPTDSIYGARHLAQKWHGTEYKDGANFLQRMVSTDNQK